MTKKEETKKTLQGIVKWYNNAKGYGFIKTEDSGDLFFHYTSLADSCDVTQDDCVEFTMAENERGKHALNIKKID